MVHSSRDVPLRAEYQLPAPVRRRGGSVRLPTGKRGTGTTCTDAVHLRVYCVCCLFPVLGPHVVCGSPVAVLCLCSLRVLFVFPSDKQSMSAALPLDFGPQANMVTPGGMRFPTPLPARHARSPRRLGVFTTSFRAAPAVGALGFLLACWTLLSSTTNATPSQATPLLAMMPYRREPRAQVRSNHYVHAVAPGAEQPAREEYYRCTPLEPEQRHRDEPHAAFTA